jgi:two-component system nitrogen regulation response regulator GlnG
MAHVLIADDQDRYAELCRRAIPEHDYYGPVRNWVELKEALKKHGQRIDVVLLDVHFDIPEADLEGLSKAPSSKEIERVRREQGLILLEKLRTRDPQLPVILMTSRDDLPLERAAEEMQAEEYTYFLDEDYVDASALRTQIEGIVRASRGLEKEGPIFWGRSRRMQRVRSRLLTLARGRLPIILGGPTGTGKSLVARHFIHRRSERRGRFVAVDLSTMPRELMAAHLFGSVKGSYTGSVADKKGAFEEADGGTLFLDEIGNLSQDAQKMLLSVLQEGVVSRIGDVRERKVDVKLVAATHEDLGEMVAEGRFRRDLFMRLNPACTVKMPSLVERELDFSRFLSFCVEKAMAGPYLQELVQDYRDRHGLGGDAIQILASDSIPKDRLEGLGLLLSAKSMQQLKRHRWPGNLREFAMTVENALVFTFAELANVPGGSRPDVVQIRPKLLRDLLRATQSPEEEEGEGWLTQVRVASFDTLNRVASEVERQYFIQLYLIHEGDFRGMASVLLGDPDGARKVQLRFNQLGLKVRELKQRIA